MATLAETRLSAAERRAVARFVALLEQQFGPDLVSVWLYGSRARGERTGPESDIDLLVITRHGFKVDFRTVSRLVDTAAAEEGASPAFFSVLVGDPDWLAGRRKIDSFFIAEVDRDKAVLYGKP